jgi:hypothetical protein
MPAGWAGLLRGVQSNRIYLEMKCFTFFCGPIGRSGQGNHRGTEKQPEDTEGKSVGLLSLSLSLSPDFSVISCLSSVPLW